MPEAPPSRSDLRDLDPPEPLLRILQRLEAGGPGPHEFLLSREPLPLYAMLVGTGWRHSIRREGAAVVLTLTRATRDPAAWQHDP